MYMYESGPCTLLEEEENLEKGQYRLVLVCLYNDRCSEILHYKRQNQSQNPWCLHGSCHPPVVKFIYCCLFSMIYI